MDIRSGAPYPAGALSNFAANRFALDGVDCAGMEGFLQSLKFSDPATQERVCAMAGDRANAAGAGQDWRATQTLYWRGRAIARASAAYQELLDRAFDAMAGRNPDFRAALLATGDAVLTHAVGKSDPRATVLTASEMCDRLHRIRRRLMAVSPQPGAEAEAERPPLKRPRAPSSDTSS
jgi:predicted NAD-dependent protein-ADP-ribosyltransferase YbiA (DUF1768 family)